MQEEVRQRNVVMAPLVAGLLGLGVGLLFAPKSGKETRADIKQAAQKSQQRAKQNMEAAQETLQEGRQRAKQYKDRLKGTAKTEVANMKQDAQEFKQRFHDKRANKANPLASWDEEV